VRHAPHLQPSLRPKIHSRGNPVAAARGHYQDRRETREYDLNARETDHRKLLAWLLQMDRRMTGEKVRSNRMMAIR
jgi:hypothetical protein